jgi:hypothetical protein
MTSFALRGAALAGFALAVFACSSSSSNATSTAAATATTGAGGHGGAGGSGGGGASITWPTPHGWSPGKVEPSIGKGGVRGFLDLRGIIHAHSVYSHDACDNAPRDPKTDAINEPCFEDFRRDMCKVGHDYVMLSDHDESFGRTEYPDVLLYRADRGDVLVTRDGKPVANRATCPSGGAGVLLLGGTETATIAVGLEGHVAGTIPERQAIYGEATASAIETMKAQHAVSILMHTEQWTPEQITTLPVDGFEMYNLHANAMKAVGQALLLLTKVNSTPQDLPFPDLVVLPLFLEDPIYLSTWGTVLAGGVKRVTTMATDCHRNSFPALLPDGERIDSYRRMMLWFSNHLLVTPGAKGEWDDRSLKDALRAGRLYGAFEVLGYPLGFDYHATEGATVHEMGDEVSLAQGAALAVKMPKLAALDPTVTAPELRTRILRAKKGGFDVVAEGDGDLSFTPKEEGAYRAEVRMKPHHLKGWLSTYAALADQDFPWVYSNAIYVAK